MEGAQSVSQTESKSKVAASATDLQNSEENPDDPDKINSIEASSANSNEGINVTAADSQVTHLQPGEKRSCCYRFWNAIFKCFAHDSIYGSFVGPHPVSFLCCCIVCKNGCKGSCKRPFVLASVATKMMWFIMLIFTIILSCFFIIPYPHNDKVKEISGFFPCVGENDSYRKVANNFSRWHLDNCHPHGGYFMVYRNFFAFSVLLLISCLIMINVKSTGRNRKRAKLHHGFWMYKYLTLFAFLLVAYFGIRVEEGGIFEYLMSWIGLLSSLIFSFAEITFLLDILDPFVVKNRTSKNDWADCIYWTFCGCIIFLDIVILVLLAAFFTTAKGPGGNRPIDGISLSHTGIICYAFAISITLLVMGIINERKKKFPYTGILQTSFVILYVLVLTWSALGNSPDIEARHDINFYQNVTQPGSLDIYFKAEGCVQGITSLLALMYYLFWHGPRSTTAPLSILFDKIWYSKATKPEIPVIPENMSENDADQFEDGINTMKVWDDEKVVVRYSWTIFYVFMILGSFAIMMGMCNFADPWAVEFNASSYPALSIKLLISLAVAVIYILVTTLPCKNLFPVDEESPLDKAVDEIEEKAEIVEDAIINAEASTEDALGGGLTSETDVKNPA